MAFPFQEGGVKHGLSRQFVVRIAFGGTGVARNLGCSKSIRKILPDGGFLIVL